ncbi:MAG: flagella basal body P-ring formation protein FlgA [Planctomycetes bacterium]|nr:flagella basal body P-ring formation protein FlgA [Planctomycetota bacterium]
MTNLRNTIILTLATALFANSASALEFVLKDEVDVTARYVTALDVVTVRDGIAGIEEQLSHLFLGAPPRYVERDYLAMRISSLNISGAHIRISGADVALVTRNGEMPVAERPVVTSAPSISSEDESTTEVSEQQLAREFDEALRTASEAEIRGVTGWRQEELRMKVLNVALSLYRYPRRSFTIRGASLRLPPEWIHALGNQTVRIETEIDGAERVVSVTCEVGRQMDVVVALKSIDRTQVISAEDIALRSQILTTRGEEVFTSIEALIGQKASRMIVVGARVTKNLVTLTPIVSIGDRVVVTQNNVTALARAEERGFRGDVIRVRIIGADSSVYARILEAGRTELVQNRENKIQRIEDKRPSREIFNFGK